MVRTVGLEPTRVTPLASKTSMSTNFITSACSRSVLVAVCSSKSIAKVKGCSGLALLLVLAIGVAQGNDPVKH